MKLKVAIIPADPSKPIVELELQGSDYVFAVADELGGFVQLIQTRELMDRDQVMMIDDDGLMKQLEPNVRAIKYSRSAGIIVGDAYIAAQYYRGIRGTPYFDDVQGIPEVKTG